jgi:hypothetical protein
MWLINQQLRLKVRDQKPGIMNRMLFQATPRGKMENREDAGTFHSNAK